MKLGINYWTFPCTDVRAALDEIGYTGHVTAEVEGCVHPELGLKHIADCLRAVFV